MVLNMKDRIFRLAIFIYVLVMVGSCASYPDDPRSPQSQNDEYTIEEDGFLVVTAEYGILANDDPGEGSDAIIETIGEQSTEQDGVVVLAEDGSFTYEPKGDFNGADQLAYTIKNEKGKATGGVIYFDVTSVNDPPLARNDTYGPLSEPVSLPLLENDEDPDGDEIKLVAVGTPDNGTVTDNGDGTVLYTPPPGHDGDARFSYTIADATGLEAEGWVTVEVIDSDNTIVMQPDLITVTEDTTGVVDAGVLINNDRDRYGTELTLIGVGGAENGIVELNDARVTYIPDPDFFGEDRFTYTVESEQGYTGSSTATVNVIAVNDPPTISPIEDQIVQAGNLTNPIVFTIEDLDNPFAEISVTSMVSGVNPPGLVSVEDIRFSGSNATRTIQIPTRPDLTGTATIAVVVSDGELTSIESFRLTVIASLTAPTAFFRYYNPAGSDHYYTINRSELGGGNGYSYEGVEGYVYRTQVAGTVPLHRYYNTAIRDHFYTIDRNDEGVAVYGFAYDRVACYVYPSRVVGTVPLYRYFSAGGKDHFYTTDWNELGPGNSVYAFEREECYVRNAPL